MNEQCTNGNYIELYCATSVTADKAAYGVALVLCDSQGTGLGGKTYSGLVSGQAYDGSNKPSYWAEIIAVTEGLKRITDKTLPVKIFVGGILPDDKSWFVDVVDNRRMTDEYDCDEPWYYFFVEWEQFRHYPSAHLLEDTQNEYYQRALTAAEKLTISK